MSEATVAELDEVLRRPKFDKYVSEKRLEFLAALVREAEPVAFTEVITACRDAKDDKFLELAVSGRASHVLSGDGDLLALHPFRGIAIVTPQAFLADQTANDSEPGATEKKEGGRQYGFSRYQAPELGNEARTAPLSRCGIAEPLLLLLHNYRLL
ncbi:MAG: putative toxin-antitoxin system toxin component, PIN family [Gemmataceae bacterium]